MENHTGIIGIRLSINLREYGIPETIMEFLEKNGTEDEIEKARSWLYQQPVRMSPKFTIVEAMFKNADDVSKCSMVVEEIGRISIPLFPVINNLATKYDGNEKNAVARSYLRKLLEEASYKDNLIACYKEFKDTKRNIIQRLRYFADEISRVTRNVRISNAAGTTASVAGSTVGLIASIFAPPGVAHVCRGVGNAVKTSGKLTVVGSDIIGSILTDKAKKNSKQLVKRQRLTKLNFIKELDIYKERVKSYFVKASLFGEVTLRFETINENKVKVAFGVGEAMEKEVGYVRWTIKEWKVKAGNDQETSATNVQGSAKNVEKCAAMAADVASTCAHVIGKGTKIADTVAGSVFIVIDIVKIINMVIQISKGSPNMASALIRETAYELERQELPRMEELIPTANIEAARECRLREEYLWPISRTTTPDT